MPFTFTNSYARLPEQLFARLDASEAPAPEVIKINHALAARLGVDSNLLETQYGAEILTGARIPSGAEPLAMAYAGHQFGNWVPQLGDGRAALLGEVVAPDGARFDIHLKGSGRTPFSRGGDGKAVVSAVLREYIVSEAMAALGVPTTRALAAVATGQTVMREGPEPGAVLTRVASSHIRVGTFQYLYARQDHAGLQALLDHVIERHYPKAASAEVPALAVLRNVMARQADLVAHWMQVGFIHGVMNTDNMAISGETIDFGPCAFLDGYHPAQVFSSIDRQGRYAFGNQARIAHWNLAQLAQSLLPLVAQEPEKAAEMAQAVLDDFGALFQTAHDQRFGAKLGIAEVTATDVDLLRDILALMAAERVDFTLFFSTLTRSVASGDTGPVEAMFGDTDAVLDWLGRWHARLALGSAEDALARMTAANPVYIPRNHRVEFALGAANTGNLEPFETLLEVLSEPFRARETFAEYEVAPKPDEVVQATFCGT